MDLNTILLIAFAVMMLFCCGGLGKLFRRGGDGDSRQGDHATEDVVASGNKAKSEPGGCCH